VGKQKPVIGLTLGEPAGIGPEIVRQALRSSRLPRGFVYRVIGNSEGIKPGRLTFGSARRAWSALRQAAEQWRRGELAAIVTAPVHKENLARVGFSFPGQTEFFEAAAGASPQQAVMMLTDRKLTVTLCSTHCSLRDALKQLTSIRVEKAARETALFFNRLGRPRARLALAGVNPHAGEGGLFGDEEKRLLQPALRRLQAEGLDITGPYAPDTVFQRAAAGEFDAVICAYHDQGLIPFKLLAFATGVNVTLGLPLIRTSPDHGTALALAGKGQADPRSMIAAIRLAARLVKHHCRTA
jgi:4-phospho-D-threonate 3-dehydrogenase / 4-phospho-D-erythronate 3-dehydrogenase